MLPFHGGKDMNIFKDSVKNVAKGFMSDRYAVNQLMELFCDPT